MKTSRIHVMRAPARLQPDPSRVIARPFIPGGNGRVAAVLDRVFALPDRRVHALVNQLIKDYGSRHRDIRGVFQRHYDVVSDQINGRGPLTDHRRLLIGAYFTMEYSLESVALFNPSLVPHPDQGGLGPGQTRFVLSLRSCGEGHLSSIEFRTGVIDTNYEINFDPLSPFALTARPVDDKQYVKLRYFRKLIEMGAYNPLANGVLDQLGEQFTIEELKRAIDRLQPEEGYRDTYAELVRNMLWLAHSNYHVSFPVESDLSERVIFPVTENESRGIEDARFVRFAGDDGQVVYYATYTAYNGFKVLPQFMQTSDFREFKIYTLNGKCVQNKGMALFPRKVGDDYCMISRLDGENIYLLRSDNIHFWNSAETLREPRWPWEFIQIGNCGSPIETDRGWVLLTHGVGPMRQYWLGALLLDLEDPSRVIGHVKDPILMPNEDERDGYVPNVVYSCGAMLHRDSLVIPYAVADSATSFATVSLSELFAAMVRT